MDGFLLHVVSIQDLISKHAREFVIEGERLALADFLEEATKV